ncbi:protein-glutamine gamma-glutamyltransferase [Gammaproteobacteria bacterium]
MINSTNLPPLLFVMTLTLWGMSANVFWLGALLGVLLEAMRFAQLQREFDNADFNRVSDLATVLFGCSTIYFVVTDGMAQGLLRAVAWLPVTTLPLILVQIISATGRLCLRNLFYSLRRSTQSMADQPIDLGYPYFAVALISASIATTNHIIFLPGTMALIAYALFVTRAPHRPIWIWGILVAIALGTGVGLAFGLHQLQTVLEEFFINWLSASEQNPYRAQTRIGDVGRIKLSDTIAWRVKTERPLIKPLLLVDGEYTFFMAGAWYTLNHDDVFRSIPASGNERKFIIGPEFNRLAEMQLSGYTHHGQALLPIPSGAYSITGLFPGTLSMNPLGAVKIAEAAPMITVRVAHAPEIILQPPPTAADIGIPKSIESLFTRIKNQIHPRSSAVSDIVAAVNRFFADGFRYSLYLGDRKGGKGLENFLTESRAGHCEYFATATTLLLKSFGVPARYVTGYSIQELAAAEGQYIARYRHAHAWTRTYVDGAWQDLDTTPAIWLEGEAEQRNPLEPIIDWFSWRWYYYTEWRAQNRDNFDNWLLGGAFLVCVWLYWRLFHRPKIRNRDSKHATAQPAKISAYSRMEAELAQRGYPRSPGETPLHWLARLKNEECPYLGTRAEEITRAHYVFKYHPSADKTGLQSRLWELVELWRYEIIKKDEYHTNRGDIQ